MLASALRARGLDVHLMAQRVDEEVERAGFPVVRASCRAINLWGVCSFAREVGQYVKEHPDRDLISFDRIPGAKLIRAGDGSHQAYLESMGQTALAKFSIKHQMLLSLERRAFTHPQLRMVIANSKMAAADVRSRYGVAEEKIRVVYTGLPACSPVPVVSKAQARAKLNLKSDVRVMLFAGHNYERKGLGTLLEALAMIGKGKKESPERSWTLLVAGRGNIPEYRTRAKWLGLAESVRFLGPCDLAEYFSAADVFVLPTLYDPLARVCLEAARSGLPVITTRRNGFSEWIGEGDGFVVESSSSAEELAGAILRALHVNLAGMGRNLQSKVAHLTIEKNAEELVECLSADSVKAQ